jgi:hypothetical protein
MLQRVSLCALILAGAFTVAQADVYRWVDEKGEPHYSDQWMPGATVVKTSKAHPAGYDSGTRTSDQKSLTAANTQTSEKLNDESNARAVQQDVARRKDAVCKQAQDQYTRAIASRRIFKNDKDGERDYMSDAEADAYRAQVRKAVQDNCGSVPKFDPNAPVPEPQPVEPKPLPEPKVNPAAATSP